MSGRSRRVSAAKPASGGAGKAGKTAAKASSRAAPTDKADRARLDLWLWRARFFKTRSLAAATVEGGRVRVNGARVRKPGRPLKIGDALTIVRGVGAHAAIDVVTVRAFGARRGPPSEAAELYAVAEQNLAEQETWGAARPHQSRPSPHSAGQT